MISFQRALFSILLGGSDYGREEDRGADSRGVFSHLLPQFSAVKDMWEEVFLQASTVKERELVVNFILRLLSLGRKTDTHTPTPCYP